jgi:uncharacterized membrane protein YoaK (UPF0700 family)
MSMRRRAFGSALRISALCVIAGFVDIVSFISVLGVFSSHITGNIVTAGSALVHPDQHFVRRALTLPAFILAVGFASAMNVWARRTRFNPERVLLSAEAVCLVALMIVGICMLPPNAAPLPESRVIAIAWLAVAAMGVHNAATREARTLPMTTAMTGNLTQFAIDLTECLIGRATSRLIRRTFRGANVLLSFIGSTMLGTFSYQQWKFWSLLFPTALVVIVAVLPPPLPPIPPRSREERALS